MGHLVKTEHAGAKNRGGFWGPREDAKRISRERRRAADKRVVRAALVDEDGCALAVPPPISPDGAWYYDYESRTWKPRFAVPL